MAKDYTDPVGKNKMKNRKKLNCFKAYDVRGRVPDELNAAMAYRIGRAYAAVFSARKVVVGHDIRLSSKELSDSLIQGLCDSGTDVVNIGLCGTEEVYHGAFSLESEGVDGGVMITASHNPVDYNGMKFVAKGAKPVAGETGLNQIEELVIEDGFPEALSAGGTVRIDNDKSRYIEHLLNYIDVEKLKPFKIVTNAGNGNAGPVIDLLESRLPLEFIKINHEPDGSFPRGVPNPLLPDQREETARMVKETGADIGLGWDGDFDRCFFWDERGAFVEGYYIVGLLAIEMLDAEPGGTILYDPRLVWNTEKLVGEAGGRAVMTRTGHSFIKDRMRKEDAVYGGEMSAHHYFRDFGYCDSGMLPWLLICSLLSRKSSCLSELVGGMKTSFPVSGEMNSVVDDPDAVIRRLEEKYRGGEKEYVDGLSVSFSDYRFNVRKSNTEPLLRLNVESRSDSDLLKMKTEEILSNIQGGNEA